MLSKIEEKKDYICHSWLGITWLGCWIKWLGKNYEAHSYTRIDQRWGIIFYAIYRSAKSYNHAEVNRDWFLRYTFLDIDNCIAFVLLALFVKRRVRDFMDELPTTDHRGNHVFVFLIHRILAVHGLLKEK